MKGIFYNSRAAICSIHETGKMCYEALKKSKEYILDYTEDNIFIMNYDFMIVNQHPYVCNWINQDMVKKFGKLSFCIVTEVNLSTDNPVTKLPLFFDHYIILNPTIKETEKYHGFGRPIQDYINLTKYNPNKPTIGSFGFSTPGKNWEQLVEVVNSEFDEAIIRINIPYATYVPNNIANIPFIKNICLSKITKPGIILEFTNIAYTQKELINWCSQNTINCFFYSRNHSHSTGLAAVANQAIASERPLLVTNDPTFRHIHKYIGYYPNISIKQAIEQTLDGVLKMKKDWSSDNFLKKFENILLSNMKI